MGMNAGLEAALGQDPRWCTTSPDRYCCLQWAIAGVGIVRADIVPEEELQEASSLPSCA